MAITDLSSYYDKAARYRGVKSVRVDKNAVGTVAARSMMSWLSLNDLGVAPTTAVVPTSTTAGALNSNNDGIGPVSTPGRVVRINGECVTQTRQILVDRLSHQGGLSAIVTTAQTTNLPTAALTRYTSGEGVMIGLAIYTTIGTTATTITASYTNQAGTSGRTTVATTFGGTSFREASRLIPLPLQAGDTGVRSVESVTVLATTGTAGNFGVLLFKPLMTMRISTPGMSTWDALEDNGGNAPEILNGACLEFLRLDTGGNGTFVGELLLATDD